MASSTSSRWSLLASLIKNFKKALTDIGWDKYYHAKLKKHCLFFEGKTDVLNLEAIARKLKHPVTGKIEEANTNLVDGNLPGDAFIKFNAIKSIEPDLKGLCIFDKLNRNTNTDDPIPVLQWKKRELENYFCNNIVLKRWAFSKSNTLETSINNYINIMDKCIQDLTPPIYLNNPNDEWWNNEKPGDWAETIFREFSLRTHQPIVKRKGNFHELVDFIKLNEIDPEIKEKLDAILNS